MSLNKNVIFLNKYNELHPVSYKNIQKKVENRNKLMPRKFQRHFLAGLELC